MAFIRLGCFLIFELRAPLKLLVANVCNLRLDKTDFNLGASRRFSELDLRLKCCFGPLKLYVCGFR